MDFRKQFEKEMKKKKFEKSNNCLNCVIVCISSFDIFNLFNNEICEYYTIKFFKDIPKDVKIQNVWYDSARRSFMYLLVHDTFPEVKEGEIPKIICPDIYQIRLEIKNKIKYKVGK